MYYVDDDKLLIHYYARDSVLTSVYGNYITLCLSNKDGLLIGVSKSSHNNNDTGWSYRYGFIPTDN